MNERRVVVTGTGVVSSFGTGKDIFRNNIREGNSSASFIKSFKASELQVKFFAEVPLNVNELENLMEDKKSLKTMCRGAKFAVITAEEAIKDSGIDPGFVDPFKFGTAMGVVGLGFWDVEYSNRLLEIFLMDVITDNGNDLKYRKVWQNIMHYLRPLTLLKLLTNIMTAYLTIKYNARGCFHRIK